MADGAGLSPGTHVHQRWSADRLRRHRSPRFPGGQPTGPLFALGRWPRSARGVTRGRAGLVRPFRAGISHADKLRLHASTTNPPAFREFFHVVSGNRTCSSSGPPSRRPNDFDMAGISFASTARELSSDSFSPRSQAAVATSSCLWHINRQGP